MRFRIQVLDRDVYGSIRSARVRYDDTQFDTIMLDLQGCRNTAKAELSDGRIMHVDQYSPFWSRIGRIAHLVSPTSILDSSEKLIPFSPKAGEYGEWHELTVDALHAPWSDIDTTPVEERIASAREMHAKVLARFDKAVQHNFKCAGSRDGCMAKVAIQGAYCHRCAHDEQ